MVNDVFNEETLQELKGNLGVGHVRYSTAGGTRVENAQPLVINYVKGTLAIAHNGNLVNAIELRKELEYTGAIFQTTIDSEVIAYHIARERLNTRTAEEAVKTRHEKDQRCVCPCCQQSEENDRGKRSVRIEARCVLERGIIRIFWLPRAARLRAVDAEFVRDVQPGEIVTITREGITSDMSMAVSGGKTCKMYF